MQNEWKIKITPGGPYEVTPGIPLVQARIVGDADGAGTEWEEGKRYENPADGEGCALCRCGRSHSKPFCDGTHDDVDFKCREVASRRPYVEEANVYRGGKVDLLDNEALCAVARYCDVDPTTWEAAERSDEPGMLETAIRKACNCPSGRLTVAQRDGALVEADLKPEISPIEDGPEGCRGPLWVKGGIPIESADGSVYEIRNRVTLCRCGESDNIPFCDASHLDCPHMKGLDE